MAAALLPCVAQGDATERVELPNGDVYEGSVTGGMRTGFGTYLWKDGHRYTGEFVENRMSGTGTYFWPDGRTYSGSFVDDERSGRGILQFTNGNRFEGTFVAGRREGLGVFYWRDGTIFQGQFAHDRMHGFGVKREPDGNREVQHWVDGELAESWPLRELSHCKLRMRGSVWMFDGEDCVNGLAHGRGLAASLEGTAVIPVGRFVLGRLVEGEVISLRPDAP